MIAALLPLLLALDPHTTAAPLLEPCGKVVVVDEGGGAALAKDVRHALVQSGRCERVSASEDAWPEGWTLAQEQLVRERLGADSQLVVVRPDALVYLDGRGTPFARRSLPQEDARPAAGKPTVFEVSLAPAAHLNPQLNRHFMITGGFTYRPWWFLGVGARVLGTYSFQADGSAKGPLLVDRVSPLPDGFLRLDWAALVAVESAPLDFPISPVVELAVGAGGTRHVLNLGLGGQPVSYASTGVRPVFSAAVGARWQPARHFTVKLTLRDTITPGGASVLNGCDADDLRAMDTALRGGYPATRAAVKTGCDSAAFAPNDVPLAYFMAKLPDAPLTHLLTVDLACAFAF